MTVNLNDPCWQNAHLFLDPQGRIEQLARILQKYVPDDVQEEYLDAVVFIGPPYKTGASVIGAKHTKCKHIIVTAADLIPIVAGATCLDEHYIALAILHELAHTSVPHDYPSTKAEEDEADAIALRWFNASQSMEWTDADLLQLRLKYDGHWLR